MGGGFDEPSCDQYFNEVSLSMSDMMARLIAHIAGGQQPTHFELSHPVGATRVMHRMFRCECVEQQPDAAVWIQRGAAAPICHAVQNVC